MTQWKESGAPHVAPPVPRFSRFSRSPWLRSSLRSGWPVALIVLAACGAQQAPLPSAPVSPHRVHRAVELHAHRYQCVFGPPHRVAEGAPSAVTGNEEHPLSGLWAGYGPGGEWGLVAWTAARAYAPHQGTWLVAVDNQGHAVGPPTRILDDNIVNGHFRFGAGGAALVATTIDDESFRPQVLVVPIHRDGQVGEVQVVGEGNFAAVSNVAGTHLLVAIQGADPWTMHLHSFNLATHRNAPVTEPFRVESRSAAANRLLLGWSRDSSGTAEDTTHAWALLDGSRVLIDGEVSPVPTFDGLRHLDVIHDALVVVDRLPPSDTAPDWRITLHRMAPGATDWTQTTTSFHDYPAELSWPGTFAASPAGAGTAIQWGNLDETLADNGSWGNTWLGQTGEGHGAFYTSPDQHTLWFRPVVCSAM